MSSVHHTDLLYSYATEDGYRGRHSSSGLSLNAKWHGTHNLICRNDRVAETVGESLCSQRLFAGFDERTLSARTSVP